MTPDPIAAHRYAQAFVTLAHREQGLEAALRDLTAVHDLIQRHPPLQQFLANPEIAVDDKQGLLTRLLNGRVCPLALRLPCLLLWNGRLALLPTILTEAARLRDQVEGIARGIVRTARPIPQPLLTHLRERLERRLQKRLVLTPVVDPALLGGVSVQLGHLLLDGSVRRELEVLRERLTTCAVQTSDRHT